MRHHRVERVELQLALGGGPVHGHVYAEDHEAALVHAFGNHRVHLGGHDARTGLARRHTQIAEAGARAGVEQAQVVGGLLQVDRQVLQRGRRGDVRAHVGYGGQRIGRGGHRQAGDAGQMVDRGFAESQVGADAGADGGGPQVEHGELRNQGLERGHVHLEERGEGVELLAEGHRHRILQLGAADGDVVDVLVGQVVEGAGQVAALLGQRAERVDDRQLAGRGIRVVGGLRVVDVVIGVDERVVAARPAGQFERAVGDDLVDVHVG